MTKKIQTQKVRKFRHFRNSSQQFSVSQTLLDFSGGFALMRTAGQAPNAASFLILELQQDIARYSVVEKDDAFLKKYGCQRQGSINVIARTH